MRAVGALALLCAGPVSSSPNLLGDALLGETPTGRARDLTHLLPPIYSRDINHRACDLPAGSGNGGGVCSETVESVQNLITFCRGSVRYRACIPAHQPPWDSWNATAKDELLGRLFKDMVEARIAREMNNTHLEYVKVRIMSNPDCAMALRHMLCWYNFPKCDDLNQSLPLCQTSCENYYTSCRFEPNSTDGLHDACRASEIAKQGLFGTGTPHADHLLAQDTAMCGSTAEEAQSILLEAVDTRSWILRPGGIVLMTAGGLVLLIVAYILLVPYGLQAYVSWAVMRCLSGPSQMWKSLPIIGGNSVLWGFALLFVVLLGVGVYRRLQLGLDYVHLATEANATASDEHWFKPLESIFRIEPVRKLSNTQRRQLIGSCTCTGAAAHQAPSLGVWVSASLLLPLARAAGLLRPLGALDP